MKSTKEAERKSPNYVPATGADKGREAGAVSQMTDHRQEIIHIQQQQEIIQHSPRVVQLNILQQAANAHTLPLLYRRQQQESVRTNDEVKVEQKAEKLATGDFRQPGGSPVSRDLNLPSPTYTTPQLRHTTIQGGVLQAKWYMLNGTPIWINAGDMVPPGAVDFSTAFYQNPALIHPGGAQEERYDAAGVKSSKAVVKGPDTDQDLAKRSKKAGKSVRKRAKSSSVRELEAGTRLLASVSKKMEAIAGDTLGKNHPAKVRKLHKAKTIGQDKYRRITKSKDELVRNAGAREFFNAMNESEGGNAPPTPPATRLALSDLREQGLRLASSARAETRGIVHPSTIGGQVDGQQHVTSWKNNWPELQGRTSAHSYNDRARAENAMELLEQLLQGSANRPEILILSWVLRSITGTLEQMAAPLSAKNVTNWNPAFHEQQRRQRETIKLMAELIAESLEIRRPTGHQGFTDPFRAQTAPTSPRRMDKNDTLADYKHRIHTLITTIGIFDQPTYPNRGILATVRSNIQQLNPNDIDDEANLNTYYGQIYQWFMNNLSHIQRPRTTVAPHLAAGANGQRLPALRQFFAECGQMAAHNALVLDPAIGRPDNDASLNALGPLANNISEDDIRAILVSQGAAHIPVIGNLHQMQTLRQMVDIADHSVNTPIGATAALDAEADLVANNQGPADRAGLTTLNDFRRGATNSFVGVVNTTSHRDASERGFHWIAFRATRSAQGAAPPAITIEYLDSLEGNHTYTQLFTSLRTAL
ncbi:hypothetical protein [Flavilitoribacter nigricans]|uniref:Uncharacterized protein n=1 Tax=Flavilitoribacter nigricans (strain ATCC 23147 / DSM 23189 / NBRC 102662 / NCIMB 1420 / SS-2) TaxID=1122177 RepID=A0A2D0N1I3_FLAN2|nr:hypothetical protein [Flavilitoribacter nigricans]PHN02226.1 hypothetical protein CRP01_33365 [Flavilitoribacter nigricans DSM 23189 = NBRC 102662]